MDILARRLTARLDHLRLSMAELERRTGLHRQTLKKLASGKATTLPPAASFLRLCEVVGLQPLELLGLTPAPGDGEVLAPPSHEAEVRALLASLDRLDDAQLALAVDLLDTLNRHAAALEGAPARTGRSEAKRGRTGARGARRAQPAGRSPA
ncbi:helix-turn-helix transcriptional regulator [Arenibaculum sp.]|jgi:transcriptional regulator with XRE-family HTH domain|uniref:helix-turn-helix domain-containing protein n=1 Tax=Arenibaculum sp. TaxID=2865862 RepID=UPI002E0EF6EA|nr:helix-turn-helix transcriptional regulator [Arenibaculum sp.]